MSYYPDVETKEEFSGSIPTAILGPRQVLLEHLPCAKDCLECVNSHKSTAIIYVFGFYFTIFPKVYHLVEAA